MLQLFGNAIGQVLLVGVLFGAGLPALYAVGLRAVAYGADTDGSSGLLPRPVATAAGWLCFGLAVAMIGLGLAIIVSSGFGYQVSFEHIIPTFQKKH